MDKGNILIQKEVELTQFDTPKSMYRKVIEIEGQALESALIGLSSGKIVPIVQNESESSEYTDLRTPDDSEIDPDKPLVDLINEIRAADPVEYPAFFYINNEKVCIKLWRPDKKESEEDMI